MMGLTNLEHPATRRHFVLEKQKANPEELAYLLESTGAAGRNRTGDLRITNALLYQLSYSGEKERAF